MKIIKNLSEQIKEELKGANEYIKDAIHFKFEYASLASIYAELSEQEVTHAMKLHSFLTKAIQENKEKSEKIPTYMIDLWEEEHKEIMEKFAKVKALQEMYRK